MIPFVLLAACDRGDVSFRPHAPEQGSSTVPTKPTEPIQATVDVDNGQTRQERKALIDMIARREALSPRVLKAMREVPRHSFVPEAQKPYAYEDRPLGIGLGQTVSQPTVVAMMTDALDLRGNEVVLEIGTGSGYQAAVLSGLVRRVETIEIVESLALTARSALQRLGYSNVRVHVGDGFAGIPELAPFDRIIITAAPLDVPRKLLEQLAVGGRMVVPVGPREGIQDLLVIERLENGQLRETNLGAVRFVPMVHKVGE